MLQILDENPEESQWQSCFSSMHFSKKSRRSNQLTLAKNKSCAHKQTPQSPMAHVNSTLTTLARK